MTIKLVGAGMIIAACGTVGFSMAASHRREEAALRQLIRALEYMSSNVSYPDGSIFPSAIRKVTLAPCGS